MTTFGLYFKDMDQEAANAMRSRLNEIAKGYGYTAERGATAGQGNLADMLQAIDAGELALVLLPDEQRDSVVRWLLNQAETVQDATISEALESIARQLNAAQTMAAQTDRDEEDE